MPKSQKDEDRKICVQRQLDRLSKLFDNGSLSLAFGLGAEFLAAVCDEIEKFRAENSRLRCGAARPEAAKGVGRTPGDWWEDEFSSMVLAADRVAPTSAPPRFIVAQTNTYCGQGTGVPTQLEQRANNRYIAAVPRMEALLERVCAAVWDWECGLSSDERNNEQQELVDVKTDIQQLLKHLKGGAT